MHPRFLIVLSLLSSTKELTSSKKINLCQIFHSRSHSRNIRFEFIRSDCFFESNRFESFSFLSIHRYSQFKQLKRMWEAQFVEFSLTEGEILLFQAQSYMVGIVATNHLLCEITKNEFFFHKFAKDYIFSSG